MPYTEQQFNLPELTGLSAKQIEVHLKLYAGYVKNVNAVKAKIAEYMVDSTANALAVAELTRRFGFEFNGMRLHELYFEALGGNGIPAPSNSPIAGGGLCEALVAQYGSVENWLAEFKAMGVMRGIGWVLLTYDEKGQVFHNVWVSDHELGHLADTKIIIAMDVWEHAFMVDYVPAQKADYVSAFLANLKWDVVESRFSA
ncbi:TPA: superoxide dismutase [Candidatus Uhrbacteria bacterium]|nr:superoxide dismutase [Candidatus Uhrbacteria bacterium]